MTTTPKSILSLSHRGAAGYAPENTLAGIRKGLEFEPDYIEIDIWNLGGELVVFHDRRLERLTGRAGLIEESPNWRELRVANTHPIPTLTEVFELVRGKAKLNIELKGPNAGQRLARFLAEDPSRPLRGFRPDELLVISFDHPELLAFKELLPTIPCGLLYYGIPSKLGEDAEALRMQTVHISIDFITPDFVEDIKKRGLKCVVYTVDEPDDIQRMLNWGVDGIVSDYVDRVHTAVGRVSGKI